MLKGSPAGAPGRWRGSQQASAAQVIAAEKLCLGIAMPAGTRVLDIGCGTGSAALAAARRNAVVTAIDLNEDALAYARIRAKAEGLPGIDFLHADAAAMPFADASFDVVISTFGLVFLPDQPVAARELARVVRPGGVIALTAFARHSIPSRIYDLVNATMASPNPHRYPHYMWSDGPRVGELLNPNFYAVKVQPDAFDTCFASSTASFDHVSRTNPNIGSALDRGTDAQREAIRDGYIDILTQRNRATDGTFLASIDYAVITGVRK